MKQSLEVISWFIMCAGGLFLAALILLAAAGLLWYAGEKAWRRAKDVYRLERMLWALKDIQDHGKVLPRPDMEVEVPRET